MESVYRIDSIVQMDIISFMHCKWVWLA